MSLLPGYQILRRLISLQQMLANTKSNSYSTQASWVLELYLKYRIHVLRLV